MKKSLLAIPVILLTASLCHAEDTTSFLSASLGQTDYDVAGIDNGASYEIAYTSEFSKYFSLEGSFINLGDIEFDSGFGSSATIETYGINLSLIGSIPMSEELSLYAKVGYLTWMISSGDNDDDGADVNYGAGGRYRVSSEFSVFAEYRVFAFEGGDVSNISIGASYHF